MRVAVDLDSVLSDSMAVMADVTEDRFGFRWEGDYAYQWDAEKAMLHIFGHRMTGKQYLDLFNAVWARRDDIEPTEAYVAVMYDDMLEYGLEPTILTYAKTKAQFESKKKWVAAEFSPEAPVVNSRDAAVWKHFLDYDVFLDDCPHIVAGAFVQGKVGIVYDQPWNRGLVEGVTCTFRAKSLPMAVNFISGGQGVDDPDQL